MNRIILFCFLLLFVSAGCSQTTPVLPTFTPLATATLKRHGASTSTPTLHPTKPSQPTISTIEIPEYQQPLLAVENIDRLEVVKEGDQDVQDFHWSPNSDAILVIHSKGVSLVDVTSMQTLWSQKKEYVSDGSFSGDGQKIILAIDDNIIFIRRDKGELINSIPCKFYIEKLSIRQDGYQLALGYSDEIRQVGVDSYIYTTTSPDNCSVKEIRFPERHLHQLEYSPNGTFLLGVLDNQTYLWDTRTSTQYAAIRTNGYAAFNGDGSLLATFDSGEITLWKVDKLQPIGFYSPVSQLFALHPEGSILAATRYIESVENPGWHLQLWDTLSGVILKDIILPSVPEQLRFSPDGRFLAILAGSGLAIYGVSN